VCELSEGYPLDRSLQPRGWRSRNSRARVKLVFESLQDAMTIREIVEQYLDSREEIIAVLDFAARSPDKARR